MPTSPPVLGSTTGSSRTLLPCITFSASGTDASGRMVTGFLDILSRTSM